MNAPVSADEPDAQTRYTLVVRPVTAHAPPFPVVEHNKKTESAITSSLSETLETKMAPPAVVLAMLLKTQFWISAQKTVSSFQLMAAVTPIAE
jgi:hypothetical protein